MKKLILVSAIAMSGLFYRNANAQIGLHFNINLDPRPVVVERPPVYDADYYYLPDVEAYYSVSNHCYYYQDGGAWVSAAFLPGAYRDYDWRVERHFAVNEARPYLHNDVYRARYGGFDGRRDWNYRDDRSRMYADRDRFNREPYRGGYDHGRDFQRGDQRFDNRNDHQQTQQPQYNNRGNWGGRDDHQQPQQPQNDNRGNYGGGNDHQQSQPQNNNNRVNDHGNDNNNGGNNFGRQGRGGRF